MAYEFLNIGGRKMSTSRGEGAAAHEIAELLPPTLVRFLMLRHRPSRAIDFDPAGDTIPRLFDEFDRIADAVAGSAGARRAAAGPRAHLRPQPGRSRRPTRRLRRIASGRPSPTCRAPLQVPGPDIMDRLATEKGSPLDEAEQEVALERIARRADVAGALRAASGAARDPLRLAATGGCRS